jgi:hypothetical protein
MLGFGHFGGGAGFLILIGLLGLLIIALANWGERREK